MEQTWQNLNNVNDLSIRIAKTTKGRRGLDRPPRSCTFSPRCCGPH